MSDAILDVQGLVGGYGKMTILNGTTFSVPAGSITTVIGPNGAGKSTVFKAIFGLLKLREGRVVFKGRDITGLSQRELLNAGICYVPQGRNIFPELSVRDNIQLGAVVAGKDITGNGTYSVQYQDTQLEIQNCGGFAQARFYTVVEIVGNDYSKTTLYGQPFSIG